MIAHSVLTYIEFMKIIKLIAIILLYSVPFQSQTLFKIQKDDLYGYVNSKGDTIIKCQYIHAFTDTITKLGFVFDQQAEKIVCFNNIGEKLFYTFQIDNGPDYPHEGMFRIIDQFNLIGFADTLGNIIVKPKFKFAYPFENGHAKVTFTGEKKYMKSKELFYWDSNSWIQIDKKGNVISSSQ